MHTPLRSSRGKKNDCKVSLIRETFKGTNTTFSFFLSLSSHLSDVCTSSSAWTEGLTRACRDTKCLSANKHTDQSNSQHPFFGVAMTLALAFVGTYGWFTTTGFSSVYSLVTPVSLRGSWWAQASLSARWRMLTYMEWTRGRTPRSL